MKICQDFAEVMNCDDSIEWASARIEPGVSRLRGKLGNMAGGQRKTAVKLSFTVRDLGERQVSIKVVTMMGQELQSTAKLVIE